MLANKVNNTPSPMPVLDMGESDSSYIGSSKAAAEQDGKNVAVAQSLYGRDVRRIEEGLRLSKRQAVPDPDSLRLDAVHATNAGRQLGARPAR
jgi:hypothetical protein